MDKIELSDAYLPRDPLMRELDPVVGYLELGMIESADRQLDAIYACPVLGPVLRAVGQRVYADNTLSNTFGWDDPEPGDPF